jgi:hypothetical protein
LAQEDSVSFTAQLRAEEKFIVTLATLTTRMIDLFFPEDEAEFLVTTFIA